MSVLVLDLEAYEAVYQKAWSYGFNKVCDINYCHTLSFYSEEVLQNHIKNWLWLNEMSCNRKYKDSSENELSDFLKFSFNKPTINTYQMYKLLRCIRYNIELDTIKSGNNFDSEQIEIPHDKEDSYELLEKAIEEIGNTIIANIPEYQEAKWGSI